MKRGFISIANILIFLGIVFLLLSFGPLLVSEAWYSIKELKGQSYSLTEENGAQDSAFARFIGKTPVRLEPVNKDFSIIIEKIGVNAPIIKDVSVTNEKIYKEALKSGVAHAISSSYPSKDPGNIFLFAHASLNFWDLGKYSTVFNLLRKLNLSDRVHIFYEGEDYIYEVVNKEVVKGWDVTPITRSVIEPILTLQTCDPPGTTINRYVVTAKLIDVVD